MRKPQEHGDHFGICVAGYPEAHPDTIVEDPVEMEKNYWANIEYLKQKVGNYWSRAGWEGEVGAVGRSVCEWVGRYSTSPLPPAPWLAVLGKQSTMLTLPPFLLATAVGC